MATYRPVKTCLWDDEYILDLKIDEKLLFIFLLTNEKTSLCGIYMVSIGYLYRITSISKRRVAEILEKFSNDNKIKYFGEYVYIVNWEKHQSNSPKIKEGIKRELSKIPQEVKETLYGIDRVSYHIDKPEPEPEPELTFKKVTKHERVLKKEFENFISLYQSLKNTELKVLDKRRRKFKARRKNFSYEDIETAMRNILDDDFLQGDNDAGKVYGDIDYILRNDEIIEKWINPLTPNTCQKQSTPPLDEYGLPSLKKLKKQQASEEAKKAGT